jgi:ATP-dependent Clp protease ATP-binding subunit ClpC
VKKGKAAAAAGPDLPYTSRAKKVLELAMSEARELNHSYVGTEHLLLGLVADDGPAGRAFAELGVTLEGARAQVAAEVPPSNNEPPGEIPLSPRARGTLEGAPRQAMGLKDDVVGTEHLLLALLIERDSRTASVLTLLGCPPDLLRTTVLAQREAPKPKSAAAGLAPALAERARVVAQARGASTPDAGDLMLALADRSAMLTRALTELGVTPQALRDAIQRARGG